MRELLAQMTSAFAAGHRMGAERRGAAIDCPIDHDQILLRLSWMDGFSEGRRILAVDRRSDDTSIQL